MLTVHAANCQLPKLPPVWFGWVFTDTWRNVNSTLRNIFSLENGDVFNTYFVIFNYILNILYIFNNVSHFFYVTKKC